MKISSATTVAIIPLILGCDAVPFHSRSPVFGLRAGSEISKLTPDEEYERAQEAILHAVGTVEEKVHNLVTAEVETLFLELGHHKDDRQHEQKKKDITKKAKKAVEKGAHKVKKSVTEHNKNKDTAASETPYTYPFEDQHPYPYVPAQISAKHKIMNTSEHHSNLRILHAVEAAEKALLHAIEDEVDTLFHHEHEEVHKEKVKIGVQKASETIKEKIDKRRSWLSEQSQPLLEDFAIQFME